MVGATLVLVTVYGGCNTLTDAVLEPDLESRLIGSADRCRAGAEVLSVLNEYWFDNALE